MGSESENSKSKRAERRLRKLQVPPPDGLVSKKPDPGATRKELQETGKEKQTLALSPAQRVSDSEGEHALADVECAVQQLATAGSAHSGGTSTASLEQQSAEDEDDRGTQKVSPVCVMRGLQQLLCQLDEQFDAERKAQAQARLELEKQNELRRNEMQAKRDAVLARLAELEGLATGDELVRKGCGKVPNDASVDANIAPRTTAGGVQASLINHGVLTICEGSDEGGSRSGYLSTESGLSGPTARANGLAGKAHGTVESQTCCPEESRQDISVGKPAMTNDLHCDVAHRGDAFTMNRSPGTATQAKLQALSSLKESVFDAWFTKLKIHHFTGGRTAWYTSVPVHLQRTLADWFEGVTLPGGSRPPTDNATFIEIAERVKRPGPLAGRSGLLRSLRSISLEAPTMHGLADRFAKWRNLLDTASQDSKPETRDLIELFLNTTHDNALRVALVNFDRTSFDSFMSDALRRANDCIQLMAALQGAHATQGKRRRDQTDNRRRCNNCGRPHRGKCWRMPKGSAADTTTDPSQSGAARHAPQTRHKKPPKHLSFAQRKRQKRTVDDGPSAALVDGETDQPALASVGRVLLLPVELSTAGAHPPRRVIALADTGSCLSLIHQNLAEEFVQAGAPTKHAQVTATSVTGNSLRIDQRLAHRRYVGVPATPFASPSCSSSIDDL